MTSKSELFARYTAHQAEAAALKADMEKAGVTKKDMTALAKAKAAADKAAAALKALGGDPTTEEPA